MRITTSLTALLLLFAAIPLQVFSEDFARREHERILGLVEGAAEMHLSTEIRHAGEFKMKIGHLNISWLEGTYRIVLWGNDERGIFLSGKGVVEYTTDDPMDAPILTFNAKTLLHKEPTRDEKGTHLRLETDRCLLLCNPITLRKISVRYKRPAKTSEGSESAFQDCVHALTNYLENDIYMTMACLESNRIWKPYSAVVFQSQSKAVRSPKVLHVYDPGLFLDESLYVLKRVRMRRGMERFTRRYLSNQKIGHGRGTPVPYPVSLISVEHDLHYEEGKTYNLSSRLEFLVNAPESRTILLDLWNSQHPENPLWSAQRHRLILKSVADEKGGAIPFIHRYNKVLLFLPEPKQKNSKVSLTVTLEGNILHHIRALSGDQRFTLLEQPWFPRPPFYAEACNTRTKVRAKKPFRPVLPGSGDVPKTREKHFTATGEIKEKISAGPVVCGKYKKNISEEGSFRVGIWPYGRDDILVKDFDRYTRQIAGIYSRTFFPYPFSELNVVEVDRRRFGGAYPGITMVPFMAELEILEQDHQMEWPEEFTLAEMYSYAIPRVLENDTYAPIRRVKCLAHEIAKQWWGVVIRPPTREDRWMPEAMAEYAAFLVIRGNDKEFAKRIYKYWKEMAEYTEGEASLFMADYLSGRNATRMMLFLLYGRGPLMLHAIAAEIGEDKLIRAMTLLAKRRYMGFAGSNDFLHALNEASGRDLTDFFNKWLKETSLPKLPPFKVEKKSPEK